MAEGVVKGHIPDMDRRNNLILLSSLEHRSRERQHHARLALSLTNGLVTSRAQSIKRFANGLSVRFFIVIISTAIGRRGNCTGSIVSPACAPLDRTTPSGKNPRNRPVATRVIVSWADNVEMLARGGSRLLARENCMMNGPGTLSYDGRTQGSFISSASSMGPRPRHGLLCPTTT